MASFTYDDFRTVLKQAGFEKLRSEKHETWRKILPLGKIFRQVSCFSDRSFSKPACFRTVRKSSYVNEAMLDLDQRTEIPVSLAGSNGFDIGEVMGPVRARGVQLAVSEIFFRVVLYSLDEVFERLLILRELRDEVQLGALRAVGVVVLGEQYGQPVFRHQDLRLSYAAV